MLVLAIDVVYTYFNSIDIYFRVLHPVGRNIKL
jgi:hypothetical protein